MNGPAADVPGVRVRPLRPAARRQPHHAAAQGAAGPVAAARRLGAGPDRGHGRQPRHHHRHRRPAGRPGAGHPARGPARPTGPPARAHARPASELIDDIITAGAAHQRRLLARLDDQALAHRRAGPSATCSTRPRRSRPSRPSRTRESGHARSGVATGLRAQRPGYPVGRGAAIGSLAGHLAEPAWTVRPAQPGQATQSHAEPSCCRLGALHSTRSVGALRLPRSSDSRASTTWTRCDAYPQPRAVAPGPRRGPGRSERRSSLSSWCRWSPSSRCGRSTPG